MNATDPRLKFGLRDYWVLRHIFTFVIKANKAGNPHGLIIIARDSFINSRMDTPGTSSSSDKERWGSSLDCGCWLYRGIPIEWSHFRCCILCYYSHKCLFEQFYLIFSVYNSIKNFVLENLEWRLQRLPLLCWRKESATWCVEKFQMQ